MPTVITLARMGLLYSFLMVAIGAYDAYAWGERAYDVTLQRVDEPTRIEANVAAVKAERYAARSKQGTKQVFSHGLTAMLFLAIFVRVKRNTAAGDNAS